MVHVTAFFAGLLGFLFLALSVNIIRSRRRLRVALGDGGDAEIMRKIRAHGNFAEYVPFCLILMAVNELNGSPKWLLALAGCALVLGRLAHAYGILVAETASADDRRFNFRTIGMACTFTVIGLLSLMAIL